MEFSLHNLTIPIWVYDIDRYCIHWANEPALGLWESTNLKELQSRDFRPITSDALQESLIEFQQSFFEGYSLAHNWHFSPKGIDKYAYCQLSGYPLEDGRMAMLVEALPIDKQHYKMQSSLTVMLSHYTEAGEFVSGNPPFLQNIGRNVQHLSDIVIDDSALQSIIKCLRHSGRFENDVLMKSHSGNRWYHLIAVDVKEGKDKGEILCHQYDIHQRKISEISLTHQVLCDPLTGLLNRRGLESKLQFLDQQKTPFLIYYIDLDGFKLINDSFGHAAGDDVLRKVADRLIACLPHDSNICRFGGDEFVVLVPLDKFHVDKDCLANSLVKTLAESYDDSQSRAMTLSASIGVARYPDDADKISNIILYADSAMYQAKHLGKRRWVSYTKGMELTIRRQSVIAQYLYYAEDNNELSLHYQPIWGLGKNNQADRIMGFEALLRWYNKELGWVAPQELVKVAEEIGIIDNIERWVVHQALSDLLLLRESVANDITMSVNVSAVNLLDAYFPSFVLNTIKEKKLSNEDLVIELTESTLIEDINKQRNIVNLLVSKGINISIDDFGAGISSLAYLHRIPASVVKMDKIFADSIENNSESFQHICQLIKTNNMQVLSEGVETDLQQQTLASFGVSLFQGYILGKPKPLSYYLN